MHHSRKSEIILALCMVMVGIFSAFILFKTFRPSKGLPYEQLTMEQAVRYMTYEGKGAYTLLDVSTEQQFEEQHIPGAVNIPVDRLVGEAAERFPDPEQLIYVCSAKVEDSRSAALKLCQLGYTNITEIGCSADYFALPEPLT